MENKTQYYQSQLSAYFTECTVFNNAQYGFTTNLGSDHQQGTDYTWEGSRDVPSLIWGVM